MFSSIVFIFWTWYYGSIVILLFRVSGKIFISLNDNSWGFSHWDNWICYHSNWVKCFVNVIHDIVFLFSFPSPRLPKWRWWIWECFNGEQGKQTETTKSQHLGWMCVLQCKAVELFHLCSRTWLHTDSFKRIIWRLWILFGLNMLTVKMPSNNLIKQAFTKTIDESEMTSTVSVSPLLRYTDLNIWHIFNSMVYTLQMLSVTFSCHHFVVNWAI